MQELVQGNGSINRIAAILTASGHYNAFLITGSHFLQHQRLDFLKGIQFHHYLKKGSNVEEQEVSEACNTFNESKASAILAIGGGSVIDLAKAIIYQLQKSGEPVPFFIAVPTTVGSGSEATSFAVVYKDKKKESLVDSLLLPRVVVLDPQLVYSLPSYQVAVTGMDTFSQAIESYWNRNATEESKLHSTEAIKFWKRYFLPAIKGDREAREKMLYAAHLAGKAIAITRTTGPHALSYYLTANFNIPHGQAVALFLPSFFIYNKQTEELNSLLDVKNGDAATFVRTVMKQAGLATTLEELQIEKKVVLDSILDDVNTERFANNPVMFDRDRLKQLFEEHI